MKKKKDLLAYCGLYCGDCAGYDGEIATAAKTLLKMLEKYKFDQTAKCLFSEELKGYDRFSEVLEFMTDLKCEKICRERKDTGTSCNIRKCCRDQRFYACFECDDLRTCEKLKSLEGLHNDACVKNLEAIKEMGLETWLSKGRRLWFGSTIDDCS